MLVEGLTPYYGDSVLFEDEVINTTFALEFAPGLAGKLAHFKSNLGTAQSGITVELKQPLRYPFHLNALEDGSLFSLDVRRKSLRGLSAFIEDGFLDATVQRLFLNVSKNENAFEFNTNWPWVIEVAHLQMGEQDILKGEPNRWDKNGQLIPVSISFSPSGRITDFKNAELSLAQFQMKDLYGLLLSGNASAQTEIGLLGGFDNSVARLNLEGDFSGLSRLPLLNDALRGKKGQFALESTHELVGKQHSSTSRIKLNNLEKLGESSVTIPQVSSVIGTAMGQEAFTFSANLETQNQGKTGILELSGTLNFSDVLNKSFELVGKSRVLNLDHLSALSTWGTPSATDENQPPEVVEVPVGPAWQGWQGIFEFQADRVIHKEKDLATGVQNEIRIEGNALGQKLVIDSLAGGPLEAQSRLDYSLGEYQLDSRFDFQNVDSAYFLDTYPMANDGLLSGLVSGKGQVQSEVELLGELVDQATWTIDIQAQEGEFRAFSKITEKLGPLGAFLKPADQGGLGGLFRFGAQLSQSEDAKAVIEGVDILKVCSTAIYW